jgi:hypothetical protein
MKKLDKEREKFLKKHHFNNHKPHVITTAHNINDTMMSMNECGHLHNNKLKNNSFLKRQIFKVFTPAACRNNNNNNASLHDEDYLKQLYYNVDNNSSGGDYNNMSTCSQNDMLLTSSSLSNINDTTTTCILINDPASVEQRRVGSIPYYMQVASDHVIKVYPNNNQNGQQQKNSASSMATTVTTTNSSSGNDTGSVSSSSAASPPPPVVVSCMKRIELFESLNKEMREKFRSGQPLLYPAKDYEEMNSGDGEKVKSRGKNEVEAAAKVTDLKKRMSSASGLVLADKQPVKASREKATIQNLDTDSYAIFFLLLF